jgi:hypothetical protein
MTTNMTSTTQIQRQFQRRELLQSAAALSLLGLAGCATTSIPSKAKVVVVGGGFGGATAAKYIRLLSQYKHLVHFLSRVEHGAGRPQADGRYHKFV